MCSAYLRGVNITVSILLQRAVILAEYEAGEDDAFVAAGLCFQAADVTLRVRRIADDQQPVRSADFLKSLDNEVRVVFRLQTRRSEEHTSELQSHVNLVCRLLLEKKKKKK